MNDFEHRLAALEKMVFPPGARFENPKDVSDDSIKWAEGVLAHKRDMGDVYAQDFFREFIRRFTAQRADLAAAQKERDLAEGNRTAAIEVQFKMGEEMERLKAELHRAQDEVARVTKRFDRVQEQAVQLKDEIDKARRDVKEQHIELVDLRHKLEAMSPAPASEAKVEELAKWCDHHGASIDWLEHRTNLLAIAAILRAKPVPAPSSDEELERLAMLCEEHASICNADYAEKYRRIASILRKKW